MTAWVILIGMSIVILCLLYLYLRTRHAMIVFQQQLNSKDQALSASQVQESKLREETGILKTKLQSTYEDPITHTLSWQVFEDRLRQQIKESERYQLILGVMMVDIDEFKMVNEALGYKVGDKLLESVAKRLETCIRQVDSLARMNKDTFAILLTQLGKPEAAVIVAQRILQVFKESFLIDEHELFISVGLGISIYPDDAKDAEHLLYDAEGALQLAKAKGKNVYQFYQQQLHAKSQRELILQTSIGRETLFNELIVYYQPMFNITDESIFCMDALLNWHHPEVGLIGPEELNHYAEKQRKNNIISEWLLRNACKQFLHWRSLGFFVDCLGVSFTISQLTHTHFIYRISQVLQELKFNPNWLLIEIKENGGLQNSEVLEKSFNMLKYIGVKMAIENFGAEGSPLNTLKKLPVAYLKLTPLLVDDIDQNPQTLSLLKAIIFLANTLSMEVIVTGIESSTQIELLKNIGCIFMQGHLLGAPLSPEEVETKMVGIPNLL